MHNCSSHRVAVRVVDKRCTEVAPLVFQCHGSLNWVICKVRFYFRSMLREEVVAEDEEVSTFNHLEVVRVGPVLHCKDDGDCTQHEQAFAGRSDHRAHTGSVRVVVNNSI